jgi:hypothetical protein
MSVFADVTSHLSSLSPLHLKLAGAFITFLAAILLFIYRARQLRAGSDEIKVNRAALSLQENQRCPHYTEAELTAAKRGYVHPDCAQVDPANEIEFRKFASVREPIFSAVKRYLDLESKRHLLILADSGMGKTTFCLNFYSQFKGQSNYNVALVSLARPNLFTVLGNIVTPRETILILDALDENKEALQSGAERLVEIMDRCSDFKMVIVTCRSHFFENDAAIPVQTGISRIVPRSAGRTSSYEFSRLYLLPFTPDQIDEFINKSFPWYRVVDLGFRKRARKLIATIPDLSVRPMLLNLVPALVKNKLAPKEIYELYDYMVSQWLSREEKWVERVVLMEASTKLALHISLAKQRTSVDRLPPEEIRNLNITSERLDWRHLTTRSLLNRDSEGNLKFAHRTIMEFLVVKAALAGQAQCLELVWSDFMRELLLSYGGANPHDLNGAELLRTLIENRSLTRFPYSDALPGPTMRARSELQSIANGSSRYSPVHRHSVPEGWLTSSVKVDREIGGFISLEDHDHGVTWRAPDVRHPAIENELNLYRVGLSDAFRQTITDGFDLPSLPEFLDLIRIDRSENLGLVSPSDFYWLGDRLDGGKRLLLSLAGTLNHTAAISVLNLVKLHGQNLKLNVYALDPYRLTGRASEPRAFEIKIRRREEFKAIKFLL